MSFYLVAAAGVLELARVEARASAEEVVNFTRLDVVGKPRDEKRVNHAPVTVILLRWLLLWLLQVVGIVGRMSHLVALSENGRLRLKRQLPTAPLLVVVLWSPNRGFMGVSNFQFRSGHNEEEEATFYYFLCSNFRAWNWGPLFADHTSSFLWGASSS